MIQAVSPATHRPALEYLARSPYMNVFITHALRVDASPATRRNVAVAVDGNRILGVACYGRQLAIAAEPVALPAFGEHAKRHRGERMILGSRATVSAF
ncbi:MAG TPA: hypothetical protein VN909_02145, partial [Candidatus Dormibacteraeota bacterium]|nr:hypothetical protein [Candidatus Dormibacteraeota bacterium]